MPQGGAFTTGLIKALRAAKGNLSYNDLFLRARSTVQLVRDNQTPQFDTVQNFDPYVRFLEGSPAGERDLYEAVSYTHLDVYKRQVFGLSYCIRQAGDRSV